MSTTQENLTGVLNALMYVLPEMEGQIGNSYSLGEVVATLSALNLSEFEAAHLAVVQDALVADPSMGELAVSNASWEIANPSFNESTAACTFSDANSQDVYIAYRGTAAGEWKDTAVAFAGTDSTQQVEASDYFSYVAENYTTGDGTVAGLSEKQNVVITGHSNGGNDAQYVTMTSEYNNLIDTCYSFDGQGFSPEQIAIFESYDNYDELASKIYGINGANDYVNVLGTSIILRGNITYIAYGDDSLGSMGNNVISNLFADGALNEETAQGDFSKYVLAISAVVLAIPSESIRANIALSAMSVLEKIQGNKYTLDLDASTTNLEGYTALLAVGVPVAIAAIVATVMANATVEGDVWNIVGATVVSSGILFAGTTTSSVAIAVAAVIKIAVTALDATKESYQTAVQICTQIQVAVQNFVSNLTSLYNYLTGSSAAAYETIITLNTDTLRSHASTLRSIYTRAATLDSDMNNLYFKVGFSDLLKILNANIVMNYRSRLSACADYLEATATDFEAVERAILQT